MEGYWAAEPRHRSLELEVNAFFLLWGGIMALAMQASFLLWPKIRILSACWLELDHLGRVA
jgi:hypothetical protein